jgi:hypothetical protein
MPERETPHLTVTVRTRLGQVLDRELEPDEAAEVHEALSQMVAVLFELQQPEQIRSVTFEIGRR